MHPSKRRDRRDRDTDREQSRHGDKDRGVCRHGDRDRSRERSRLSRRDHRDRSDSPPPRKVHNSSSREYRAKSPYRHGGHSSRSPPREREVASRVRDEDVEREKSDGEDVGFNPEDAILSDEEKERRFLEERRRQRAALLAKYSNGSSGSSGSNAAGERPTSGDAHSGPASEAATEPHTPEAKQTQEPATTQQVSPQLLCTSHEYVYVAYVCFDGRIELALKCFPWGSCVFAAFPGQ